MFGVKPNEDESEEKRIKIVRDKLNDSMPMSPSINQWGETTLKDGSPYLGADLMQYLNTGEGSYYSSLSNISKRQMSLALWNVGALYDSKVTPEIAYKEERSDVVGTNKNINYTTKWVGKIGLIYPSDFAYAGKECLNISNQACGTENWLNSAEWTMTPVKNHYQFYYVLNAYIATGTTTRVQNVLPSVYLKSNIKILVNKGNGTSTSPYILSK